MSKINQQCDCEKLEQQGYTHNKALMMLREKEQKMLNEYGYYIHYVFNPNDKYVNCHTHGIKDSFSHDDFQIVIPIDNATVNVVFHYLVEQIKQGIKFKTDISYPDVIDDYDVQFKEFKEMDRTVLRIIFPDMDGRLPEDPKCEPYYANQVSVLKNI